MAGEVTNVAVSQAFGRNAVEVTVTNTDPNGWSGNNGRLRAEYSLVGPGGPWITPANVQVPNNHCFDQAVNDNILPGVTGSTSFSIFDPAIPHATDVWVRVTAIPQGPEPDPAIVVGGPATTRDYPTFACQPNQVTDTTADMALGGLDGLVNISPCDIDDITWEWGTTAGGPYPNVIGPAPVGGLSPSETLTGLTPDTDYFYRARMAEPLVDTNGEYLVTQECSFRTLAVLPTADCAQAATAVTDTEATVNSTVTDVPADHTIHVGVATDPAGPFAFNPGTAGDGTASQAVAETFTGLTPNTDYFTRIEIRDPQGNLIAECDSAGAAFTTEPTPTPTVTDCDEAATNVGPDSATVNATVENVPADHTINIGVATTAGGPFTFNPGTAGDGTASQAVAETFTGLTPNTPYFTRIEIRDAGGAVVATCDSTGANFTTEPPVDTNPNNATCAPVDESFRHHTQARMEGTADNVDPADFIVIAISSTPGGPYTNFGPTAGVPGDGTAGQAISNVFTGLPPASTVYYRTEVRQGSPTGPVISASDECQVDTRAANDPGYMPVDGACSLISVVERDAIDLVGVEFDDLPLVEAYEVLVEHQINGGGFVPVPAANLYTTTTFTTSANPAPVTGGSNSWRIAHPYAPGDVVDVRFTSVIDGTPFPDDTAECQATTFTEPDPVCAAPSALTMTTADINFGLSSNEAAYDFQGPIGDVPDNRDTLRVVYGTTSGGPYPNTTTDVPDGINGGAVQLTGLTPGTEYFYRMQVDDAQTGQIIDFGECSFTAMAGAVTADCTGAAANVGTRTATINTTVANVPTDHTIHVGWSTAATGPFTYAAGVPGDGSPSQALATMATGLTPGTPYFTRVEIRDPNGTVVASCDSNGPGFTTIEPGPGTPFEHCPSPVNIDLRGWDPNCGGGASDRPDVESVVLCDVDTDGNVLGSAIGIYAYDETGTLTGPPTFVDPVTGAAYTPQGTLVPCGEPSHDVELKHLCDEQADGSVIEFCRHYVHAADDGAFVRTYDTLLDGSVYNPTGTVGSCDPHTTCTPSPARDLGAECGPGEPVDGEFIADQGVAPDARVDTDPAADGLCGGQWVRSSTPQNAPFPVEESFRNPTFDEPGPVTQGSHNLFFALTADPAVQGQGNPAIPADAAGEGWGRGSDQRSFTNGMWQVPTPFPTTQGMTFEATIASHDGTQPIGGDGMVVGFTDGASPPQAGPIGGGGSLGMGNWDGGYVGVVLDEFGGVNGQRNTIQIRGIGPNVGAGALSPRINVGPNRFNLTTRAQPLKLRVSIIEQFGQTFVSASIDWNDGNGFVQYFDRERIDDQAGPAPATLRMGINMSSGGSFRSVKEIRDAAANQGGVQWWRQYPITTDPIDECVETVDLEVCVDHTFDANSQDAGDGDPEAWLWITNTATNTVVASTQWTSAPTQVGTTSERCLTLTDVDPADVPDLRIQVGAETREAGDTFAHTWDNLRVTATGQGCPAEPVRTLAISAPCPLPVTIVGGDAEGGGGGTAVFEAPSTLDYALICATVGGVRQSAFLKEVRSPDGDVTVQFLGTDGIEIVPESWTPGECSIADTVDDECLADDNGIFFRRTTVDEDGTINVTNVDAAGQPYTPVGNIRACGEDADFLVQVLCDGFNTFQRIYQLNTATGQVVAVTDVDDDGSPFVPAGPTTLGPCPDNDTEAVILCDALGREFVRIYQKDGANQIIGSADRTLDGTANFAPVQPVGTCAGAAADRERICYTLTSTGDEVHVGWARHDDDLPPTPQTPNGIAFFDDLGNLIDPTADGFTQVPCAGESATVDVEELIVCADGEPAIQRTTFDADGAMTARVFIGTDGAVLTPTEWVPGACDPECCPTPIAEGCFDDGAGGTGRWVSTRDPDGTVTLINPVDGAVVDAADVVDCPAECCPIVLDEGCWDDGTATGTWVSTRQPDGTVEVVDPVSGATVAPADVVDCPTVALDNEAHVTEATADTTITPTGQLISWSVRARTTGVTVDAGDGPVPMDVGETISAEAEHGAVLTDPPTVGVPAGGSARIVWVERI